MSFTRIKQILSKSLDVTTTVAKETLVPAVLATNAFVAHEGIQIARQIDNETLKNQIKNAFSYGPSIINEIAFAVAAISFIRDLKDSKALTPTQGLSICLTALAGFAGFCVASANFSKEQTTASSGYAAAAGFLLLGMAGGYAKHYTKKNEEAEMVRAPLLQA